MGHQKSRVLLIGMGGDPTVGAAVAVAAAVGESFKK